MTELASQAAMTMPGPNATLIQSTFEDHNIVNKYDAIVMNPPFGIGGRMATEHLRKAMRHINRDGARIVALLPDGPAANKKLEALLESKDGKNFYLAAEVLLPPATFERAKRERHRSH